MLTERSRGGIFIRNLGQAQIIFLTLTLSHRERELPLPVGEGRGEGYIKTSTTPYSHALLALPLYTTLLQRTGKKLPCGRCKASK